MSIDPHEAVAEERVMSRFRTIGSFAGTAALSGGVSVISIPLIVLFTSSSEWAAVALGQAIGSSVGVLAMFGWGITGPARIAMMDQHQRATEYWNSVCARLLLFVPALIITVGITWAIVPTAHLAATMCAVAIAFGGLSGSWYLVGNSRGDRLFWLDTVPRVAGTAVGVGVLALSRSLELYAVAQLLGSVAAFLFTTAWAVPKFRRPEGAVRGFRPTLGVLAGQRHGVAMAVAVASYYPVVLAIVAGFAPRYLPLYALNEKLLRFATMAMQPAYQYFQASVPAQKGKALAVALRKSMFSISGLAAFCWVVFAVLLPVASHILTNGQVQVPVVVSVNLGLYMGLSVVTTHMMTVALVAVNRVSLGSHGALVASALGLVAILLLALSGNGTFISWGFVATSVFVLAWQIFVLVRAHPSQPADGPVDARIGSVLVDPSR